MTYLAAWGAGAFMIVLATSVVGLFAAPVAVPLALVQAARRRTPWAIRVPLVLGALALTLLVAAWLFEGANLGGTTGVDTGY